MGAVNSSMGGMPSFDPTNPNWDTLSQIMKSGKASRALPLGTNITVPYDGATIQMMVVGHSDAIVKVNGVDTAVPAVQLMTAVATNETVNWSSSGSVRYNYPNCNLSDFINTNVAARLNLNGSTFLNYVGESKVGQFYTWESKPYYTYSKLFVPSVCQLGESGFQPDIEGPVFDYFNVSDDEKKNRRKKLDQRGTAVNYWTRSIYGTGSARYVDTSGNFQTRGLAVQYNVAFACNFIG